VKERFAKTPPKKKTKIKEEKSPNKKPYKTREGGTKKTSTITAHPEKTI